MSGLDPVKPDDRSLDEFLRGEGPVAGAYRAAAGERPPAALDATILAHAREAVRAAPPPRRTRRWQPALATAAVLVLSLGVLLQVQRDPVAREAATAQPAAEVEAPAVVTQDDTPATPSAAEAAPAPAAEEAKRTDAKPQAPKPSAQPALAEPRRAAPMPGPPPPPPPPAAAGLAMDAAPNPWPAEARSAAVVRESEARRREGANEATPEAAQEAGRRPEGPAPAAPKSKALTSPLVRDSAAAPMAKSQRVAPSAGFMAAPVADESEAAIEHWATTCEMPARLPLGSLRWRGLAVSSWSAQASDAGLSATLRFAPGLAGNEIGMAIGALANRVEFVRDSCAVPVVRELRDRGGWALVCECAQPR